MTNNNLPTINALWIGSKLGLMASACLKSFIKHGHVVNLYTYQNITDIPKGINILDANDIIDESKIFRHHKRGSYAPFSDVFRYNMLKVIDNGIYVDCDVYCLKPMNIPEHGHLLGYENPSIISNAILALPKESELLDILIHLTNQPYFTPEWYSTYDKIRLKIKRLFGRANTLGKMGWGVTGPSAVTYYTKQLQLTHLVQEIDVLYPIQHHEAKQKLLDEKLKISDIISQKSMCVHLYNETLRGMDLDAIADKCILSKMLTNEI